MDATSPADTDPTDGTNDGALPPLDALLRLSADGDRAAFAALYDATVPWVHALSRSVLASDKDAAEATALVYLTAWDEAPDADLDLTEDDDVRRCERTVFTWLEVLAHRVVTTLARTDSLPERGHGLLPENAGKSEDVTAERPLSCRSLTDDQYRAVSLAWLGGRTARRLAEELDVPAARAKELVRDGVQALVAAHRDTEQQRGTLTGPISTTPPRAAGLTDTVRGDVDAGRGLELADLAALDALDSDEHTLVEGSVAGRGPSEGTLWRTRLRAARNAVTWAFRSHQEEPPSDLLDRILRRLPAQDIGVSLVDHEPVRHTPEEEAPRRRRLWAVVGITAVLVLAALVTAIVLLTGPSLPERVDRADDVYASAPVETRDGGTMQVATSRDVDAGYVRLQGLQALPQGQAYQLWLLPKDESREARSLGVFSAQELAEPVTFHGVDAHSAVGMTVEPEAGAEQPSDDVHASVVLRPCVCGRSEAGDGVRPVDLHEVEGLGGALARAAGAGVLLPHLPADEGPHAVHVGVLGEVGVQGSDLRVLQAGDVHGGVHAGVRRRVEEQVTDPERLQALVPEQLRVGVGVLHRRVGGPDHGLAAGQMVRVGALDPLPVPLGVQAEDDVRADLPHHPDERLLHAMVRLEVSVPLAQEADLLDAQGGGRGPLLGMPARGHRLRALRVEAARIPVRDDALHHAHSGGGEAAEGGGGAEVEVVGVGADGERGAPAVACGEVGGGHGSLHGPHSLPPEPLRRAARVSPAVRRRRR